MPKKKGKGGKNRRKAKNFNNEGKKMLDKDKDQEYAIVSKMLGNSRVTVIDNDGAEKLGIIRGSMRKKVWINKGDLILIANRGFQDDKVDIIHRYQPTEMRKLQKNGVLNDIMFSKCEPLLGDSTCNTASNHSSDFEFSDGEENSDKKDNLDLAAWENVNNLDIDEI